MATTTIKHYSTTPLALVTRVAALLIIAALACADPDGFVTDTSLSPTCTSHPASPHQYGHHLSPQPDSSISIAIRDSLRNNATVQTLCPGATYQLEVSFPERREFLVTGTAGNMTMADPEDPLNCTNRFISYLLSAPQPESNTLGVTSLRLGCAATMPGNQYVVRVTSATGEFEHHLQASASFAVNSSCAINECVGDAALPSSPPAPPSPSPPPPSPPSPPPSPQPPANRSCTPSSLGYSCSLQPSGNLVSIPVTVHWSVNVAQPVNLCTGQLLAGSSNSSDPSTGVLNMAIEARTSGYVGLGFATSQLMTDSDVVMGWVNAARPMVDVWHIGGDRYSMSASSAVRPSWLLSRGIAQSTQADGSTVTTLCFSRPWSAPSASVSSALDPAGSLTMILAAADPGVTSFGQEHRTRAGFIFNPSTGQSTQLGYVDKVQKMNVHGALMAFAWVLLLPLGSLVARHKWLLGEAKLLGVHAWFQLHRAFQLSGMVLFIVGFAYAWQYLPGSGNGDPTGGSVGKAHQVLGTIIMGLAGVQVILGATRPKPDASWRPQWNAVHHNLGRLTMVSAWATIYMGIYIAHGSLVYQASYMNWMLPVALVMGLMVVADVVLTVLAPRDSGTKAGDAERYMVGNEAAGGESGSGYGGKVPDGKHSADGAAHEAYHLRVETRTN